MKRTAQIFLCYARQNETQVKELYDKLKLAGFEPWMDIVDLVGGEEWRRVIEKTIQVSDFFIACISMNWGTGRKRFFRREIRAALNVLPELEQGAIYIIPLRLEECEVPESLSLFQWIDYFYEDGWNRLTKAIHKGIDRLGLIKPVQLRSQPILDLSINGVVKPAFDSSR